MKYSIITYNFNNYEVLRQIDQKSDNCEYIYITDNPNLKSNTWKIVLQNQKLKSFKNVWQKCYYIRYHLFEFCNTQYCLYLDGSMKIKRNLDVLMNDFINSNSDVGLMTHPWRSDIKTELDVWINFRCYNPQFAINQMYLKSMLNNYKDNILYQLCVRICKNTQLNQTIDGMVYQFLKYIGYKNKQQIERQDQTVYTMIVNHFFSDIKIFNFTQDLVQSSYLDWYLHGTNNLTDKLFLKKLDNHYYIE